MKKLITTLGLVFGLYLIGFSQEYLQKDIIKLSEISTNKKYGYNKKKPIKTGSIEKEYHFLNALRGPNGEKVKYVRQGSCCPFRCKSAAFGKGFLDVYQVSYEGGKTVTLYLNGYEYEDLKCPVGFTYVTPDMIKSGSSVHGPLSHKPNAGK